MSASSPAGDHGDDEPHRPGAELVRAEHGEERAHQHHPLEADVHDAAALGEHAADRGERERRRADERRGEQRAPDDDLLEVVRARARGDDAEEDPDEPGRAGAPPACRAPRVSTHIPHGDREQPDEQRDPQRVRVEGRQRDHERREPDADADRPAVVGLGPTSGRPRTRRCSHRLLSCGRPPPGNRSFFRARQM